MVSMVFDEKYVKRLTVQDMQIAENYAFQKSHSDYG